MHEGVPCDMFHLKLPYMHPRLIFAIFLFALLFADKITAQSGPTRHEAGLQFSGVNFKGDKYF